MATKKRGLGRGLDALLGNDSRQHRSPREELRQLPLELIRPGKYQPRKAMNQEALSELADSIRAQGVMQPIVVRPVDSEHYEIIAGERRWRASQLADLATIPVVIREVGDESAVAMSLIENIQREDLNPIEEATALGRLQDEFNLTHQQVADAVGKSRTAVTNSLRLMTLAEPVARMLETGELDMGHARALLGLTDSAQVKAALQVVRGGLNVRQAESLVKRAREGKPAMQSRPRKDPDTRKLEDRVSATIGQPVSIEHGPKGKGKVVITYNNLDELDGVLKHLTGDSDW